MAKNFYLVYLFFLFMAIKFKEVHCHYYYFGIIIINNTILNVIILIYTTAIIMWQSYLDHPPATVCRESRTMRGHILILMFNPWTPCCLKVSCPSTKLAYVLWRDRQAFVTEMPSDSCMSYVTRLPEPIILKGWSLMAVTQEHIFLNVLVYIVIIT